MDLPQKNTSVAPYLDGIIHRSPSILKKIYSDFFPGVLNHVENNSGNRADAEDVFQEALIVIYRKLKADKLILTSSFHTFLFAVCKRIWLNKNSKKRGKEVSFLEDPTLIEESIEDLIEKTEQYQLYRTKFKLLGADCQKLLQLFFDGTRMEKIAAIMGYGSTGYAKRKKYKCKEKLTQLIQADPHFKELKNKE